MCGAEVPQGLLQYCCRDCPTARTPFIADGRQCVRCLGLVELSCAIGLMLRCPAVNVVALPAPHSLLTAGSVCDASVLWTSRVRLVSCCAVLL